MEKNKEISLKVLSLGENQKFIENNKLENLEVVGIYAIIYDEKGQRNEQGRFHQNSDKNCLNDYFVVRYKNGHIPCDKKKFMHIGNYIVRGIKGIAGIELKCEQMLGYGLKYAKKEIDKKGKRIDLALCCFFLEFEHYQGFLQKSQLDIDQKTKN